MQGSRILCPILETPVEKTTKDDMESETSQDLRAQALNPTPETL